MSNGVRLSLHRWIAFAVNVNDGNMEIQREEEIQTTVVNNAISC